MNVDKKLITTLLDALYPKQLEQVRDIVLSMYLENDEENKYDDEATTSDAMQ
ncbi:hypothetical protein AWH56_005930 [Anaerobacillus isosaccharinicus]|uniref:Uncharacterized protein n=1 Tax=Anaerobacillus isosaccharinicus TaxID=1532552 RepID=A0A7S7RCP8_9BACI|nr:hypothetical protein [Anaerobacillus isosaccharinicus]MBA5584436.1 hypothetical protein [Anaerobacillus isosaccharinicus]QOY37176.1 hypothetical protein AWH56_005930 [Anaerobacillus isosaccharinicus]